MVIQRSWKILSDSGSASPPTGLHSSSDDSNCSNQTLHSMVTSVASPPNAKLDALSNETMKYFTTPQMVETMFQRLKQRYGCAAAPNTNNPEAVMHSLELLRITVQNAFDKEVNSIIKQYMQNYFKPAFKNIKENLGQNAFCEEDMLQKMSCALLENSKAQYHPIRMKTQATYASTNTSADNALRLSTKRPAARPLGVNELPRKIIPSTSTHQQIQGQSIEIVRPAVHTSHPFILSQKSVHIAGQPGRRQIFWNTGHISTTTKFVLDIQANQAFGFGTDGKERLASKHPELIRYLPDSEDRDWLASQNIIAMQNRNVRFLFLIYDEVCRLRQTHELHRNKTNIDLSVMQTFTVPEFMIQKMKLFFVDLNIKSRGLITNSFSVGVVHGNSHLRNALLQGVQTVSTTDNTIDKTQLITTNTQTISSENSSLTNTQQSIQSKQKTSTLSSSHATLTALLNNSAGGCNDAKPTSGKVRK